MSQHGHAEQARRVLERVSRLDVAERTDVSRAGSSGGLTVCAADSAHLRAT